MKKRVVSLLLALVMMTSLLPAGVWAEDAYSAAPDAVPQAVQQEEQGGSEESEQNEEPVLTEEPQADPASVEGPAEELAEEPVMLTAANGAEAQVGNCSNGYVTDIKIWPGPTKKTNIPGYTFAQAKTYNEITLYNTNGIIQSMLSVDKDAAAGGKLAYMAKLDGKPASPAFRIRCQKIRSNKTTDISILLTTIAATSYGEHTLSVQVGKVDDTGKALQDGYDEYVFTINLLPEFSDLTLKDGEQTLTTTPAYSSPARFYGDTFAVTANGATITFTGKYRDDEQVTKCYIGSSETPLEPTWDSKHVATVSAEITLADYFDAASGNSNIPLRLVYEKDGTKRETTTYLNVFDHAAIAPVITRQPDSITCDKLETPTLSVAVTAPANGKLSYQWYSCGNIEFVDAVVPIDGATDASYTLTQEDTSRAGTWYYRCEVTNTFTDNAGNTQTITVTSDAASVKTLLSFVSKPTILRELGTFVVTADYKDRFIDYRTEYIAGERFELMYIGVALPEDGVKLSYEYFVNTTPDYDTAEPLEVTYGQGWTITESIEGKKVADKIVSARPTEGFAEGSYYIFCKVTASAEGLEPVSVVSMSPKLTFKRIELEGFTGSGTKDDPYQITSEADFARIRDYVYNGQWCAGVSFKMMNDVALSADWQPIGGVNEALTDPVTGRNTQQFSGILDGGGHKLTVAKGGKSLFNNTSDAVIENLDIYGEQINGNGLIDGVYADYGQDGNYWTGVPDCVTIRNVRLLKGSSTLKSGFMEGSGSGKNNIYIQNCVIQENVTIGYDKQQSGIGSFVGGSFNGEISNSYSAATVYGIDRIGGLAAAKGQSMGDCQVVNSHFSGQIIATGDWVGGLIGKGYTDKSAPNTMAVSFINSYVDGDITGNDYVGGLFGGEGGMTGCLNECWLKDSHFYGTINAIGEHVGGIIGYLRSIDAMQHIENNYFYEKSGKVTKLIGEVVQYNIDDSFGFADEAAVEAFKANMGSAKTEKEFKDGTVLALLNEGSDYKNWVQGTLYPALDTRVVIIGLDVAGEIKNQHYVGDALDLSGLTLTAKWSDGTTTNVPLNDPDLKITGYDSGKHGQQTVTLQYGAAKVEIVVTVLYKEPEDITVTITLLGDKAHGDNGQVHGLSKGGLTAWVSGHKVEVTTNMTVWDALKQLPGVTWDNPTGNYIKSVTYGGVTIGEFTNGKNSGWMYTLNGKYPMLGVSEQYLKKGDVIVFHYTDDYTLEAADMGPAPEEKKTADEVIALINAIGVVDLTKGDVIAKARAAYDALSAADKKLVTNYQTLLDAEAAYAKLVAELGKKADSIYKTTGDYLAKLGTPGVGSIGGEWMALGLARSGRTVPEGYYDAVVKYVKDNIDSNGRLDKNKATENARIILALTAIGKDVTNVDGHDLLAGLNEMSYLSKQGINGAIFTLIALDSHSYTPAGDVTRDKLVQAILDAQISSDGGWSLDGKNADVDMTAMAIQALAAYYKSNSSAKKAVDKGLSWLSSVQQNDGGFTSWGAANSESCAQVIVALTALGINPAKDSRFIKNGVSVLDALCSFAVNGGGFKHLATETSANGMATEQGFYALVAYYRLLNGQSSLYDMTDVKLEGVKAEKPVNDTDKSDDTADTDTPVDTEVGEASSGGQVVLWVVIGVVAVGGIAALAVTSKKRHGRDAE